MNSSNKLKVSQVLYQHNNNSQSNSTRSLKKPKTKLVNRKIHPEFLENEYKVYQRKSILKQDQIFRKEGAKAFNDSYINTLYEKLYSKKKHCVNRKNGINKNQAVNSTIDSENSLSVFPDINHSHRNIKQTWRLNTNILKMTKSSQDKSLVIKECNENDLNISFESNNDSKDRHKNNDKQINMFNTLYKQYQFFQSKPPVKPYYSYSAFYKEYESRHAKKNILVKECNNKQKRNNARLFRDVFNKALQVKLKGGLTSRASSKRTFNL